MNGEWHGDGQIVRTDHCIVAAMSTHTLTIIVLVEAVEVEVPQGGDEQLLPRAMDVRSHLVTQHLHRYR